jgi:hypothetical protein
MKMIYVRTNVITLTIDLTYCNNIIMKIFELNVVYYMIERIIIDSQYRDFCLTQSGRYVQILGNHYMAKVVSILDTPDC